MRRSARNGEMSETSTMRPASAIERGDLGRAADVLDPVGRGEAEVAVEPVAEVVAVEQVGVPPDGVQLALDDVGDGRLARAGEPGEPHHRGALPLERGMCLAVDLDRLPVHVVRPPQGEVQQPGADRVVGQPVDDDEAAHVPVLRVGVEGDGRSR